MMTEDEKKAIRTLAAHFTGLGSRVTWDGDIVRSIAIFGENVQDKHLTDLRGFPGLKEVNLTRSKITDAGLFYIGKLRELEALWLGGTVLTDEGFEQLDRLTKLKSLNLTRTGLSDDGVRYFEEASALEALWLECTDITDVGVQQLKRFTQLELLDLTNTAITDAALETIGTLSQLEELSLSACEGIDGAGLSHISNLPSLESLWIDNTEVRDDIVPAIAKLPLKTLSLNWTNLTDEGLQQLDDLPLTELHLIGSRVSDEAAADYRSRHPNCAVHHTASRSMPPH